MHSIRGLSLSSVICAECFALTSEVVACKSCHYAVPLVSEFVRDPSLSRRSNAGHSTPADYAFLQEQLARAKRLLRKYEFLIDALDESCAQVDDLIDYCSSCLKVGVKRLPAELLSLIFKFSCADTLNNVSGVSYTPSSSISISQVCQSWRHVALRTPLLWNIIAVQNLSHRMRRGQRERIARFEILDMYLRRSRFTPLKVVFSIDAASPASELQGMGTLLSREAYDRMVYLHIHTHFDATIPGRLARVLPCLEELIITGVSSHGIFQRLGLDTPEALPKLRTLRLPELPESSLSCPPFLSLRFLTLSSIVLHEIPSTTWWTQAPHLEELDINEIDIGHQAPPPKTVLFSDLKRLTFRSPGLIKDHSFQPMSLFNTPHLQSLSIWCPGARTFGPSVFCDGTESPLSPDDPCALVDFFLRAKQCTSLTLEDILLSPTTLREMLDDLSSLHTLKLRQIFYFCERPEDCPVSEWGYDNSPPYRTSIGPQLFHSLVQVHPTTNIPVLLPALLNLEIETSATCLNISTFIELLHVRILGERQLKTAKFSFIVQPLPQAFIRDLKSFALELSAKTWKGSLLIQHDVPTTLCGEMPMNCDTKMVSRRVVDIRGTGIS